MNSYDRTRERLEHYFDRTAARTWERLTSDAPVSGIRQTVREGRDKMRASMMARLPEDMTGLRVLDAGCGAGPMTQELAARGAEVVAIDISPQLLEVAKKRLSPEHAARVTFIAGDMLSPDLGDFDYIMSMDSLIHYTAPDIAAALVKLAARTRHAVIFTLAPKTPMLQVMHMVGKLFPRSDRSPEIIPHSRADILAALEAAGMTPTLTEVAEIRRGFYISLALELRP